MGNVIRYTDLSWEIPGPRADVDLPLHDITYCLPGPSAGPLGPVGPVAPDDEPRGGKPGHGHDLEEFEQF